MVNLLAGLLWLASFGCWIVVLVAAFRDELWKGIVGLLCGLYWLYYAIFEFEHESKWTIVLIAIFGGGAAAALRQMFG